MCIRIKYTNNEAIKTNSSCGINKAAYNNSSYLRLSGKGGWQNIVNFTWIALFSMS